MKRVAASHLLTPLLCVAAWCLLLILSFGCASGSTHIDMNIFTYVKYIFMLVSGFADALHKSPRASELIFAIIAFFLYYVFPVVFSIYSFYSTKLHRKNENAGLFIVKTVGFMYAIVIVYIFYNYWHLFIGSELCEKSAIRSWYTGVLAYAYILIALLGSIALLGEIAKAISRLRNK